MKRMIELATTLNETGDKRISIMYDDIHNKIYIKEGDDMKLLNGTETKIIERVEKEIIKEVHYLNYIKPKKPQLTKKEHIIGYYYFCMTHNFGQGDGKMMWGWKEIPFNIIERLWFAIKKKYGI